LEFVQLVEVMTRPDLEPTLWCMFQCIDLIVLFFSPLNQQFLIFEDQNSGVRDFKITNLLLLTWDSLFNKNPCFFTEEFFSMKAFWTKTDKNGDSWKTDIVEEKWLDENWEEIMKVNCVFVVSGVKFELKFALCGSNHYNKKNSDKKNIKMHFWM
jgi:hypothetical protein